MKKLGVLIVCLVSFLFPISAYSALDELYGEWVGGGRAAEAIYGAITISSSHLAWHGKSRNESKCVVAYEQIQEPAGREFKDQFGDVYIVRSQANFKTYLLKLAPQKCTNGVTYLRLTTKASSQGYLDLVEYQTLDHPVGYLHFNRQ